MFSSFNWDQSQTTKTQVLFLTILLSDTILIGVTNETSLPLFSGTTVIDYLHKQRSNQRKWSNQLLNHCVTVTCFTHVWMFSVCGKNNFAVMTWSLVHVRCLRQCKESAEFQSSFILRVTVQYMHFCSIYAYLL